MDPVAFYGFSPCHRPKQDVFKAADFPAPDSPLAREVRKFAQAELNEQTFNHSNRVYIYGVALTKTHFPSWKFDLETYYFACLLHDIGTANRFLATTKMSFEFKGAIVARDLLLKLGGVEDQADSICDAIIRHQDIFVKGGNITMIGQVLQLATILGEPDPRANLVHPKLIETTCAAFPRKGWSECFAKVIETELKLKPWCHTTTFEVPGWKEGVQSKGNAAMKPFD
ncbi:hypothetical protein F5887DRAFT_959471 [Amanita rubescens]|nr:hypothetical protein F5887DRAFT_959471 [Amanita rubescens]